MLDIDWRSAAAYQHLKVIPAAEYAWEYLRRDDDYHAAILKPVKPLQVSNRNNSRHVLTTLSFTKNYATRWSKADG